MLPRVPHLINIAQLGGPRKEEEKGFGGQVKLCLPRKARSFAKSQLSLACAKQIVEHTRAARLHSSTASLWEWGWGEEQKNLGNTEEAGCHEGMGGTVLFVRCPGLSHLMVPQVGISQGSQPGPAGASARILLPAQRRA